MATLTWQHEGCQRHKADVIGQLAAGIWYTVYGIWHTYLVACGYCSCSWPGSKRLLVTQKLTECRIKNATFERRKQRGERVPKRIQGCRAEEEGRVGNGGVCGRQGGKEQRAESREQREDTCQHTPHKANVQGHETITDAKQESGNKPGERGRWVEGCRCGACEYACATAWTLRGGGATEGNSRSALQPVKVGESQQGVQ